MALSSSLSLITISFFLSILAGHAVRDIPNCNISDINASAEPLGKYVLVATLYPSRAETWESNCFKHNQGIFNYDAPTTLVFLDIEVSNAISLVCSDYYELRVNTQIVQHATIVGPDSSSTTIVFTCHGCEADIETYGLSVFLKKRYKLGGCDQKKESGLDIVKEVKKTLETF